MLNSKFEFARLPDTAGIHLWKTMDVVDLIALATTSEETDWFSRTVAKRPTKFSVHMDGGFNLIKYHWILRLDFSNKPSFIWNFYQFATLPFDVDRTVVNIGIHKIVSIITTEEDGSRNFNSYVVNINQTIYEVIDWVCKFFHCDVAEVKFERLWSHLDYITSWNLLKTIKNVSIEHCDFGNQLEPILAVRHSQKLRTSIKYLNFLQPTKLSNDVLFSIDFSSATFDFSLSRFDDIVAFVRHMMKRDMMSTKAHIGLFTRRQVEVFKTILKLSDFQHELHTTHQLIHTNFVIKTKKFQFIKDNYTALVFIFFEAEGGLFNQLLIDTWFMKTEILRFENIIPREFIHRERNVVGQLPALVQIPAAAPIIPPVVAPVVRIEVMDEWDPRVFQIQRERQRREQQVRQDQGAGDQRESDGDSDDDVVLLGHWRPAPREAHPLDPFGDLGFNRAEQLEYEELERRDQQFRFVAMMDQADQAARGRLLNMEFEMQRVRERERALRQEGMSAEDRRVLENGRRRQNRLDALRGVSPQWNDDANPNILLRFVGLLRERRNDGLQGDVPQDGAAHVV